MNTKDAIINLRKLNPYDTLQKIGDKVGTSREYVRQELKKANLPTIRKRDKNVCKKCGGETNRRNIFCSAKCRKDDGTVLLSCTNCEVIFSRSRTLINRTNKDPRYTTKLPFCSNKCKGSYVGKHYGWGKDKKSNLI